MKRFSKIISGLVLLSLLTCIIGEVRAEDSNYYNQKKQEANSNSKQTQEKIDDVEGKIDEVLQEVANLNSSILEYEGQIKNLSNQLAELEDSITQKEQELAEKKQLLEDRLVAMYMKRETTFLDVVLSGNLMNFISNQDMVKQIATYDNNLINEVETLKNSLQDQKTKVEELKKEKEEKNNELQKLKAEKEQKVANLSDEQKDLEKQLSEYKAQAEKYADLERQAIAAEEKARQEAARKTASNNTNTGISNNTSNTVTNPYTGGKLGWPCPSSSRITSPYGYRILYGVKDFHTGIDIGAVQGSNICAAESGTVILANYGWNGGYGNYIIISHGNGITTRYAHASKLNVSAGQTVTKGQVIGEVGNTGNSFGAHLHFEVRINGSHTNPLNYL